MPTTTVCPSCQKRLRIPDGATGKAKCSKCGSPITLNPIDAEETARPEAPESLVPETSSRTLPRASVFVAAAGVQRKRVLIAGASLGAALLVVGSLLLFKAFVFPLPDRLTLESKFKENMAKVGGWEFLSANDGADLSGLSLLYFEGLKNNRLVSVTTIYYPSGRPLKIVAREVSVYLGKTRQHRQIVVVYSKDFRVSDVKSRPEGSFEITEKERQAVVSVANEMLYAIREWSVID